MSSEYNVWNKWDPLKTVLLGDCYGPEFFRDIKNSKIRSALVQIAEETKEDLFYYESILKQFGCKVLRPKLDSTDSILNYISDAGRLKGTQGVPRSPLQPRDCQLVIGNNLFYTGLDHPSIKHCLDNYNKNNKKIESPLSEKSFNGYKGSDAPDWPAYSDYIKSYCTHTTISDKAHINAEFAAIHKTDKNFTFSVDAPSITVVGKDIYIDIKQEQSSNIQLFNFHLSKFSDMFADFRINTLQIGGHSDGCFHTLKPGVLLSLKEIQTYKNTFPGWDVCYLSPEKWNKMQGFNKIKKQVAGKWWVPEQEDNQEFTSFVESWLQDWVGYVEETVFDVNVLVLDKHHVCVSNLNPTVTKFLKKHNMEPVLVPYRHRFFWDGGLHCITLDLHRDSSKQDYFPDRKSAITDCGFD